MYPTRRILARALLMSALGLIAESHPLSAQPRATSSWRMASRADLEIQLSTFDRLVASTAYGERTRAKARREAESIRRRLSEGDFRVGDRVLLRVDGGVSVDDTVTVMDGVRITVRGIRQIELAGVLRSEILTKVATEVTEVVKNATVSVRPLTRVAVFGAVEEPGYLSVPFETTLDQLLSLAGGPTANAAPDRMRLMRADTVLLGGREVTAAIAQGRTLEALDLREGDVLDVTRGSAPWDRSNTLQIVLVILSPLVTLLLLR